MWWIENNRRTSTWSKIETSAMEFKNKQLKKKNKKESKESEKEQ